MLSPSSIFKHSELLGTKGLLSPLQMAITAALGHDSYLVMRHGAGPGTRSGSMDDVIAQIQNLSAEDALGRQRLGCCFCSDTTSLVNVYQIKSYICGVFSFCFCFCFILIILTLVPRFHICLILLVCSQSLMKQ